MSVPVQLTGRWLEQGVTILQCLRLHWNEQQLFTQPTSPKCPHLFPIYSEKGFSSYEVRSPFKHVQSWTCFKEQTTQQFRINYTSVHSPTKFKFKVLIIHFVTLFLTFTSINTLSIIMSIITKSFTYTVHINFRGTWAEAINMVIVLFVALDLILKGRGKEPHSTWEEGGNALE